VVGNKEIKQNYIRVFMVESVSGLGVATFYQVIHHHHLLRLKTTELYMPNSLAIFFFFLDRARILKTNKIIISLNAQDIFLGGNFVHDIKTNAMMDRE
jgi:hypothetical protein